MNKPKPSLARLGSLSFRRHPSLTIDHESAPPFEDSNSASCKRVLSTDSSQRTVNANASASKKPRHIYEGESKVLLLGDDLSRLRSSSPGQILDESSSIATTTAMLDAAEGTGDINTARPASSPARVSNSTRPSLHGPSRSLGDPGGSGKGLESRRGSGAQLLNSVSILEFLQQDERPTFVVDLTEESNFTTLGLRVLFANVALEAKAGLLDLIEGVSEDPTRLLDLNAPYAQFKAWTLGNADLHGAQSSSPIFSFSAFLWRTSKIRKRLLIVSGQPVERSVESEKPQRPDLQPYQGLTSSSSIPRRLKAQSVGYFDSPAPRRNVEASASLDSLVARSFSGDHSPLSDVEISPLAHGDLGLSELVSGTVATEQKTLPAQNNREGFEGVVVGSCSDDGFFDWTRVPLSSSLPTHVQFARSIDWAATSLGPIETWSADLRGMCNLIMASPHPAAMYWGKDNVAIYNESYILLAGQNHPALMGSRYQDIWVEIWDAIADVFQVAHTNAQATMKDDDCLFLCRNGFLEETYFSWSIIPLIGKDGSVVGLYNPAFEKTRRKIAERRMLTLREMGEKLAGARHVSQFWGLLLEGLEFNEYDAPLVMVYALQDEPYDNDAASTSSGSTALTKQCILEGALGIEPGHPAAPRNIDLKTSADGFAPAFRRALQTNKPVILREDDGTLDTGLLEGIDWRGFGDPSTSIVISPIHPTTGASTLGFLIMATNPRRPYDEDYDLFVQLLGRQLATSVASVVLFEEEIERSERAARLAAEDRIELSNQLAARTQEAVESEVKFTRMATLVTVGLYIGDQKGIFFTNDAWSDITGCKGKVADKWLKYVKDEDYDKAVQHWNAVTNQKVPVTSEFRFKTPWRNKSGHVGDTWVLASAYPELDSHGHLKSIFGSITDISSQKFAEAFQTRRMEEALEVRRQQENFIDITSHEMRNPLSAILQCSDEISATLIELKNAGGFGDPQLEVIESNIDAAQTITLCAQHQKRIVDDVLTLSRLDSARLLVTPVDVQPVDVVHRALKMFAGELSTADIAMAVKIDASYHDLHISWVRLDPSRLLQVLINLTTNAIKFTTTQEKRTILMHVAASTERPSQENRFQVTYIPSRAAREKDPTASADWGTGEAVYLRFAVQDTGKGLTTDEIKILFQRFSQASPRTHVTYGGSGLGLFISRELVELQGGEIGVASESGTGGNTGSTFAFYVKARRSSAPTSNGTEEQIDFTQPRKDSGMGSRRTVQGQGSPAHPPHKAMSALPSMSQPSSESLKILVVEDNLVNQKVLAKQLRVRGCEVYVANHGGEAIEQIKASNFYQYASRDAIDISIVLMDMEMPVMDGQTCARKLREMQASGKLVRHVPVIAVTANAREEQIQQTLESGIDDVVSKPFRVQELLAKVEEVIKRCKAQEGIRP